MHCNICGKESGSDFEQASVRSNVRKFASEQFAIWRCPHCKSIHARDEVDLGHYYADYPFHKLKDISVDWMLSAMYDNLLARLKSAGLKQEHRILDFGCGSGLFIAYLRKKGYSNVFGYDEYSENFADKSVLADAYDCVTAQDVIEHVPEPQDGHAREGHPDGEQGDGVEIALAVARGDAAGAARRDGGR